MKRGGPDSQEDWTSGYSKNLEVASICIAVLILAIAVFFVLPAKKEAEEK